ncbi:hypothetical protein RIEGSTA812A_PEG_943 [invertebrate metagenome]|uniref:Uncharacterized protein n=1 Tax=invertebrate metagenome TaxID=1711999 RepID=A0A484H7B4_9ZZZZ
MQDKDKINTESESGNTQYLEKAAGLVLTDWLRPGDWQAEFPFMVVADQGSRESQLNGTPAGGFHLIVTMQKPSVDVLTDADRCRFQTTSKIDRRTILGEQGAEQHYAYAVIMED